MKHSHPTAILVLCFFCAELDLKSNVPVELEPCGMFRNNQHFSLNLRWFAASIVAARSDRWDLRRTTPSVKSPKLKNSSDVGCFRFRSEPHESFWRGEKSVSSRSQPQIRFTRWGRKKNVCNLIFLSSTTWRSWLRLELNINILNVNCLFFL